MTEEEARTLSEGMQQRAELQQEVRLLSRSIVEMNDDLIIAKAKIALLESEKKQRADVKGIRDIYAARIVRLKQLLDNMWKKSWSDHDLFITHHDKWDDIQAEVESWDTEDEPSGAN